MSSHTPGPWETGRTDIECYTTSPSGRTERVMYVYRGSQPRIAIFAGHLNNAVEDAKLIASAPALLRRCEKLETILAAAREHYTAFKILEEDGDPSENDHFRAACASHDLHDALKALEGAE